MGSNGQGKTSLLDAILWAIAGRVPRLGDDTSQLVSKYSRTGTCRVSLGLRDRQDNNLQLTRSFDGQAERFTLGVGDEVVGQDRPGQSKLVELMWPTGLSSARSESSFLEALTRSVYLQQDLVRQFVEADTEQNKFRLLSDLLGAGILTEFQQRLERERKAWSESTNKLFEELEANRARLASQESHFQALSSVEDNAQKDLPADWNRWWERSKELGVSVAPTPPGAPEAQSALDVAIKELQAHRNTRERRRQMLAQLQSDIRSHTQGPPADPASLVRQLQEAEKRAERIRSQLVNASKDAAEERHRLLQEKSRSEEIRLLAQIALRHLGEKCPICQQTYAREETRKRLAKLAEGATNLEQVGAKEASVTSFSEQLALIENQLLHFRHELQKAEAFVREWTAWTNVRDAQLLDLGITPRAADLEGTLNRLAEQISGESASFTAQIDFGEKLSLRIARIGENVRRVGLEREAQESRTKVEKLDAAIRLRRETGTLASRLIEALREASVDVVDVRLQEIEPLLQRIYSTIDPHPTFRVVRLLLRLIRGQGRLTAAISDPLGGVSTEFPHLLLSSSQNNALAVSVFLAMNLGLPEPPLDVAILDDPLQSLDDINLLGLLDLLRRAREHRQLLLSTHEQRFGHLLERKLRPVKPDQRTSVIELDGWNRDGPSVRQYEVAQESEPIKIAATA
jgi:DNA repair exonuclease SbcCD ATPase subunit